MKGSKVEMDAESEPSKEESQLWRTSQRPPASDPEEGLRRLLMDNQVLVIERRVASHGRSTGR